MIDLSKFCIKDGSRPYLATPFSIGDFTYATNGAFGVRVPRMQDVPEREDAPDASKVFVVSPVKLGPVPSFTAPELPKCPDCRGKGKLDKCTDCDGEGIAECCECGHEAECRECDGRGGFTHYSEKEDEASLIACHQCDGLGHLKKLTSVRIADKTYVDAHYLEIIAALPNVQIDFGAKYMAAIPFVFDGGDGLIMPVRGNEDTAIDLREKVAA